jgi:predicted PurR-regulated permease PerM
VPAVLHILPYIGPVLIAAAAALAAIMQYESFTMVLLVAGVSLAIATVAGTFASTWMTGRIAKMSPAADFDFTAVLGLHLGVWGMLLSIPVISQGRIAAPGAASPCARLAG